MPTQVDGLDLSRPELVKFVPVFETLEMESQGLLGVARPRFAVEQFMSRPYSEVMKVRVTAAGSTQRIFVKIARSGDAAEARTEMSQKVLVAFETMRRLHDELAAHPGLSVAKAVACFPEHLAIVTQEATGQTLYHLLDARAVWWPDDATVEQLRRSIRRVGEWLRYFQELTPGGRVFSLDGMREYVDDRLNLLAASPRSGLSLADREGVLQAFDVRASRLRGRVLAEVPVHADLNLGNVIVSGENVVVLDFSTPVSGSTYHDVAHLHMQLDLLTAKPKFRPRVTKLLQRSLVDGFQPTLHATDPLFELLTMQHVVCHLLGLVRTEASPAVRLYNGHIQRRHRRWLRRFVSP